MRRRYSSKLLYFDNILLRYDISETICWFEMILRDAGTTKLMFIIFIGSFSSIIIKLGSQCLLSVLSGVFPFCSYSKDPSMMIRIAVRYHIQ